MSEESAGVNSWIVSVAGRLTPRRIRAHAMVLALCLWGVCVVDYATPGMFDRGGNIKFQDFLQFPIAARLITQGRAGELYDPHIVDKGIRSIVGRQTNVHLEYFYGPQVALPFIPLLGFSFLAQAGIWIVLSVAMYFSCVHLVWKNCGGLKDYAGLVVLCAIAYPPLFHFFMRGHISVVALVCFTAAYLAFRSGQEFFAGIALGFLAFKPQFLVAITFVLLIAPARRAIAGLILSAAGQLTFAFLSFGSAVMYSYFLMLLHSASQPASTELRLSPIQMHSVHSFWELLVPWPRGVWIFYILSSVVVIALAVMIWRHSSSLAIRYSALVLASVLANQHIYIYDLLVLVPALLLLADWTIQNPQHPSTPALRLLLYLAFLLPLFGPLARWTRLQLSVPVFAAILWVLYWLAGRERSAVPGCNLGERASGYLR